jgi:hypothetical protein
VRPCFVSKSIGSVSLRGDTTSEPNIGQQNKGHVDVSPNSRIVRSLIAFARDLRSTARYDGVGLFGYMLERQCRLL